MKILTAILVVLLLFTGCANRKTIQGRTYDTYGLLNKDTNKNPNIEYRISAGNVIWSILLFETIVFPVYFVGFSIYEPVGPKLPTDLKGVIQ